MRMVNYGKLLPSCLVVALCLFLTTAQAQQRVVTGTVYDEERMPLPGVTVLVKGTATGSTTDFEGKYRVELPSTATSLVFSFIGYTRKEVEIGTQSVIDVTMDLDTETLQEVVVVGYGTQRRREVTGAITKLGSEKIMDMPTPSFEAALQGKAAGVQVIQSSGLAGAGSVIRIRGIGSVSAGGDPLYVVDGVPITQDPFINGNRGGMNQNPLATLNPNDIESIEILKDAGAAGIYGSRGANGVILITTKRGKSGKPSFNFSSRVGVSEPAVRPTFLSGQEWLQMRQEAWENDGGTGAVWIPGFSTAEASAADRRAAFDRASQNETDWWDLVTQTGFKHEYNLSVSQGTQKMKSFFGLSYSDNASYLRGNSFERLAGRANIDYAILPNLTANLSSSLSRGINNRIPAAWDGGLGAAMSTALPIFPVRNDDGSYFTAGNNPARVLDLLQWRTREIRTINNLTLDYEPIKDLSIKVSGGIDYMDIADDQFRPQLLLNSTHKGEALRFPTWVSNYTGSATASYNYSPSKEHRFTFLGGMELQKSITERYDRIAETDVDGPLWRSPAQGPAFSRQAISAATQQWSFISYFGRVNYTHKDRYVLTALARVDGSSRFGRNNRYGFFPAISGAWIISEENFMKNISAVSLLKLRSSFGITGNANIPNYERFGTFSPAANNAPYNQQGVIFPTRLENPNLRWETLENFDFGLELGLFNDRFTAEMSYFNKLSRDILFNRQNPPSTGFGNFWENVGEIRNRGLEITLNSRNTVGEFKWTTNFNIAFLNNEVLDIGDLTPDAVGGGTNDTRIVPGAPVGANFLVRFYKVDPADGLPIWLDKEGFATKEFSLDHRVVVGNVIPDFVGGITNTFEYKGFDLSVLFSFTRGGNIYDGSGKRQLGLVTDWNMRSEFGDRWRQPGDEARFPRLTLQPYPGLPDEWQYNSTMFLYDASFVRLRNLTVGYNLPSNVAQKFKVANARFFLTGVNILTWSRFPGGDPEIARDFENPQDRNMSPNITYLTPPQERSITLGLNLSF